MNRAVCFERLSQFHDVVKACTTALESQALTPPLRIKALYRRANAHFKPANCEEAAADLRILQNETTSNENTLENHMRKLSRRLAEACRARDVADRDLYSKMFGRIAKTSI